MLTKDEPELRFGEYCLSRRESRVLRGGRAVALTPKAIDVLYHLASRPDRLVTKEELLSTVWPDVVVSDASIKVCVREIRKALADDAERPRFIETVHRKGYRFVAPVEGLNAPHMNETGPAAPAPGAKPSYDESNNEGDERHRVVGREHELAQLGHLLDRARAGTRQVVFVTGGPGAGKTALVDAFIRSARQADAATTVAVGHCFEQFGASEPYLPVWEAIGRVARQGSAEAVRLLNAQETSDPPVSAATAVPAPADREAAPGPLDRRLRHLADGLESLAEERGVLVLVLEDLHWADYSTLDLISAIARRRGPERLLVLGTYRPEEVMAGEHPLRAVAGDLLARRLAVELPMSNLDENAVARYVSQRLGGRALPSALTPKLHDRTGGNPLFLVSLVEDLIEQGVLREGTSDDASAARNAEFDALWVDALEGTIPRGVREMIVAQFDRLTPAEQRVLEAGAVAGVEFSAAGAAGALGEDIVAIENTCDDLARRHRFLERCGDAEWPDGALANRFGFTHDLFHNAVYAGLATAKRARMHAALGQRLETAWGDHAADIAAELALHFERGRDWPRAVRYLRRAADAATRQYAHREAVDYLHRAHAAMKHLSDGDRAEHELGLLLSLGINLQVTKGCAAPEVEQIHARAYDLVRAAPEGSPSLFPVLWGIWVFHKVRSDLPRARELAQELLAMAKAAGDDAMMLQAHQAMSVTALCSGDPRTTVSHMRQAATIYDVARHAANAREFGQDPGVACLAFGAVGAWLCGDERGALDASRRAIESARVSSQPSSLALGMHFAAILHQLRRDPTQTRKHAEASIAIASEEGFSFWFAGSTVLRGWSRVMTDDSDSAGIDEIRRGVSDWLDTGSRTYHTYYLGLLADALLSRGRADEAMAVVTDAIAAAETLEGLYEAELHRLRGACLLKSPGDHAADARRAFQEAQRIARQQGAKALETRASRDLQVTAARV